MNVNNNTLRNDSASFRIKTKTETSHKIGAVVCPNCSHTFIKLTETADTVAPQVDYKRELIQAGVTLATGYLMLKVTLSLIVPIEAFSTINSAIQTSALLLTIFLLWFALPLMQYMRLYKTWLDFIYWINGAFIPLALVIALINVFKAVGGAS